MNCFHQFGWKWHNVPIRINSYAFQEPFRGQFAVVFPRYFEIIRYRFVGDFPNFHRDINHVVEVAWCLVFAVSFNPREHYAVFVTNCLVRRPYVTVEFLLACLEVAKEIAVMHYSRYVGVNPTDAKGSAKDHLVFFSIKLQEGVEDLTGLIDFRRGHESL
jgi:hypothetical protein